MEDKECEETCGVESLKQEVDAVVQQHKPMKMIDGCNSLATAKSARTSFSPSPTCEGADRKGQRSAPKPWTQKCALTYLEVKLAALMLKKVAFDSAATALA